MKIIFFIVSIFCFIAGFILRDMLFGLSADVTTGANVRYHNEKKAVAMAQVNSAVDAASKFIDIRRVVIPKKAVRGNPFELIVNAKMLKSFYGGCNLIVSIGVDGEKERFILGSYPMNALNEVIEGQDTQIGPIPVLLPEGMPVGNYIVEVRFESSSERRNVISNVPYPRSKLEMVRGMVR